MKLSPRPRGAVSFAVAVAVASAAWFALGRTAVAASSSPILQVQDDTGARLQFAGPARRIVSLSPGTTEMLFAAGAGGRIVATVTGADEPEAARKIPRIGDANALVYDRLLALKPDVIVIWKDLTHELVIDSLVNKLKLPVYYVSVRSLQDIPQSVRRLGVLAGTASVAELAATAMDRKIAQLPEPSRQSAGKAFSVFYMMWDVPLYTAGSRNVMSDAIRRCGGRNLYDDIDFPAPIVEFKDIKKRNPDVILMAAPPITARDWRERWMKFPEVSAVANRQLLDFVDARFSRMGPGAIDAVPQLCTLLAKVPR